MSIIQEEEVEEVVISDNLPSPPSLSSSLEEKLKEEVIKESAVKQHEEETPITVCESDSEGVRGNGGVSRPHSGDDALRLSDLMSDEHMDMTTMNLDCRKAEKLAAEVHRMVAHLSQGNRQPQEGSSHSGSSSSGSSFSHTRYSEVILGSESVGGLGGITATATLSHSYHRDHTLQTSYLSLPDSLLPPLSTPTTTSLTSHQPITATSTTPFTVTSTAPFATYSTAAAPPVSVEAPPPPAHVQHEQMFRNMSGVRLGRGSTLIDGLDLSVGGSGSSSTRPCSDRADGERVERVRVELEQEMERRRHCEKVVAELHHYSLQLQEQVAVFSATEKQKHLLISQLDTALNNVVSGWKRHEKESITRVRDLEVRISEMEKIKERERRAWEMDRNEKAEERVKLVKQFEDTRREREKDKERASKEVMFLRDKLSSEKAKTSELKKSEGQMKVEVEQRKIMLRDKDQQIKSVQSERERLEKEVGELRAGIAEERERRRLGDEEKVRREEEGKRIMERIEINYQTKFSAKDDEISNLRTELRDVNREHRGVRDVLTHREGDMKQVNNALRRLLTDAGESLEDDIDGRSFLNLPTFMGNLITNMEMKQVERDQRCKSLEESVIKFSEREKQLEQMCVAAADQLAKFGTSCSELVTRIRYATVQHPQAQQFPQHPQVPAFHQQPQPPHHQPQPPHHQPQPPHHQPQLSPHQPQPPHHQPQSSHQQPQPPHHQPQPPHHQPHPPQSSHQQPQSSHQQPQSSHQQPQSSHQQPQSSHQQPRSAVYQQQHPHQQIPLGLEPGIYDSSTIPPQGRGGVSRQPQMVVPTYNFSSPSDWIDCPRNQWLYDGRTQLAVIDQLNERYRSVMREHGVQVQRLNAMTTSPSNSDTISVTSDVKQIIKDGGNGNKENLELRDGRDNAVSRPRVSTESDQGYFESGINNVSSDVWRGRRVMEGEGRARENYNTGNEQGVDESDVRRVIKGSRKRVGDETGEKNENRGDKKALLRSYLEQVLNEQQAQGKLPGVRRVGGEDHTIPTRLRDVSKPHNNRERGPSTSASTKRVWKPV